MFYNLDDHSSRVDSLAKQVEPNAYPANKEASEGPKRFQ